MPVAVMTKRDGVSELHEVDVLGVVVFILCGWVYGLFQWLTNKKFSYFFRNVSTLH